MPEANVEKRSAADECSDGPAAKKAAKESRACAGVTSKVARSARARLSRSSQTDVPHNKQMLDPIDGDRTCKAS